MVNGYFEPAVKLIYAIGAVVGVDRSRKSLRQIQFRRPGHGKDLRQLDGGVRLSDRLRHGLKIIFRHNVLVYDNIRNP